MGLGRRGLACLIAASLIGAGATVGTRAQADPNDPGYEFQWGLGKVGAAEAWEIGRGEGATVAVLDTGVDLDHEDLKSQLRPGGWDFVNRDAVPQDDEGQGTHVAGIVAAATGNGIGVAGMAGRAKILPVKVLHDAQDGFEHNIVDGVRFAIEKKVDVLLLNLGANVVMVERATFRDLIGEAWRAGIIPVLSADHEMVRADSFAEVPALVVGGLTRDGAPGAYSSGVGPAMWGISAPGGSADGTESDIFSAFWAHREGDRDYGNYVYSAGNIQAAAHVAGAAAILRGLGQTPEQTVERLLSSATDAGPTGRDRTYGAGILNAGKSVRGLPAQRAGASGTGSPTSAPPPGDGAGPSEPGPPPGRATGAGPTADVEQPGAGSSSAATAPGAIGTPAGGETPANLEEAAAGAAGADDGEVVGGLAVSRSPEDMPARTPLLPLIALLLLVGSGAITWALRRRTLEPAPPVNSSG